MGWFDNEEEGQQPGAASPQSSPPRPASKPTPVGAPDVGSTLGRKIHVDGTIICDEDLTILGRVDGTILSKGTLVIAKGADVRAKIDGQRVLVHGKVSGNVQGAERVVLGQTARLTGNIEAPTLEIIEGAYFKGDVEMQLPKAAKQAAKREKEEKPKVSTESAEAADDEDSSQEDAGESAASASVNPVAGGPSADKGSASPKQATR